MGIGSERGFDRGWEDRVGQGWGRAGAGLRLKPRSGLRQEMGLGLDRGLEMECRAWIVAAVGVGTLAGTGAVAEAWAGGRAGGESGARLGLGFGPAWGQ